MRRDFSYFYPQHLPLQPGKIEVVTVNIVMGMYFSEHFEMKKK